MTTAFCSPRPLTLLPLLLPPLPLSCLSVREHRATEQSNPDDRRKTDHTRAIDWDNFCAGLLKLFSACVCSIGDRRKKDSTLSLPFLRQLHVMTDTTRTFCTMMMQLQVQPLSFHPDPDFSFTTTTTAVQQYDSSSREHKLRLTSHILCSLPG